MDRGAQARLTERQREKKVSLFALIREGEPMDGVVRLKRGPAAPSMMENIINWGSQAYLNLVR